MPVDHSDTMPMPSQQASRCVIGVTWQFHETPGTHSLPPSVHQRRPFEWTARAALSGWPHIVSDVGLHTLGTHTVNPTSVVVGYVNHQ
jgi:hypothetical protein